MSLTSRDKKLLILLAIVIFLALYIKFLLMPKINSIGEINSQINTLNDTYSVNLTYKNMVNSIESDVKIITQRLNDLRKIYPPNINSEELLVLIKRISDKAGIEVSAINFEPIKVAEMSSSDTPAATEQLQTSMPAADVGNQLVAQQSQKVTDALEGKIAYYFNMLGLVPAKQSSGAAIVVPDGAGYCVSVRIVATGTNNQIKKFYDELNKLDNKAYCKEANIEYGGSGLQTDNLDKPLDAVNFELKLSTTIEFYGIMDSGAGEYYMLPNGKWIPYPAYGTTNIFQPSTEFMDGIIDGTAQSKLTNGSSATNTTTSAASYENYDFAIVTSSFGGGFTPSVSISCKNVVDRQKYQNPIAYGDNKGVENVELFIEQKNGKFYCKFKTDHESYPDKQYNEVMEFTPNGSELVLSIISADRINKEDTSGVNVNITNNTKLKLVYKVINDNSQSPRVKIGKTVGDVVNGK